MSSRCPGVSGSIGVINMCQSHLEQGWGSIECLIWLFGFDGVCIFLQSDPALPLCIALHSENYLAKIAHSKKQKSPVAI